MRPTPAAAAPPPGRRRLPGFGALRPGGGPCSALARVALFPNRLGVELSVGTLAALPDVSPSLSSALSMVARPAGRGLHTRTRVLSVPSLSSCVFMTAFDVRAPGCSTPKTTSHMTCASCFTPCRPHSLGSQRPRSRLASHSARKALHQEVTPLSDLGSSLVLLVPAGRADGRHLFRVDRFDYAS